MKEKAGLALLLLLLACKFVRGNLALDFDEYIVDDDTDEKGLNLWNTRDIDIARDISCGDCRQKGNGRYDIPALVVLPLSLSYEKVCEDDACYSRIE